MAPTMLTYDDNAFRAQFPYFKNPAQYSTVALQNNFNNGTNYISNGNCGYLQGTKRQTALYLMTAHLTALSDIIAGGETPGIITQSRIDKIQVTMQPPPGKDQFQWWLSLTPWGQQLYALLGVASAGGWLVGGLPERQGFRRVGGGFGGSRW